jgi:probable rRNA maturation factor
MQLHITKLKPGERIPTLFLESWLDHTLIELGKEKNLRSKQKLKAQELSLVFVNRVKIKKLNKDYRGVNAATDVLSFEGDGVVSCGELIFCLDVIKDKADAQNLPIKCYLALLLTHGFLHLLGYEHESGGEDEAQMFTLQNKIMRKVAAKLAPRYKTAFDVE